MYWLRAEIIDADGKAIAPFTLENCRPFTGDKTSVPITWQGAEDLATLAGKAVSLRFALRRGALYSFWVSRDAKGHSGGFVAGGGLGYTGHRDL